MKHYAGLDVSVKETSVCIVDEAGKIIRELKVPSHPLDLVDVLRNSAWRLDRIGLEAGPLSQWLFSGLADAGLPVVCIETRHTKAFLKAQVNKSDRNDARGIAQMMRVNLFQPVHVKTLTSRSRRDRQNSPLRSEATVEFAEYGHRSSVRTRHLNLAIMDIRALSISFSTRPRRPKGPPDYERAGETFFPCPLSNSQTSTGKPTIAFGLSLSRSHSFGELERFH